MGLSSKQRLRVLEHRAAWIRKKLAQRSVPFNPSVMDFLTLELISTDWAIMICNRYINDHPERFIKEPKDAGADLVLEVVRP